VDERTNEFLRVFKKRGVIYIIVPALVVAVVVAIGISGVFVKSFARSMALGLNGMVAGGISGPEALGDPRSIKELQGDIEALERLGSFASISIKSAEGRVVASTGNDQISSGLDSFEQTAFTKGLIVSRIGRCVCGDIEFMVAAPLTASEEGAPFGVVRGHRDISLVAPFIATAVTVFTLVILAGAFVAVWLFRQFIHRAELAIADDQRIITALDRRLKGSLKELEEHTVGTLQALVAAVDARDTYTAHHSLKVADYACAIANEMGLGDRQQMLERAGLLHDIGKIGVSEYALLKPGRLTPEEYASIKEHCEIGARIVEMAPFLNDLVPVVRHHHERWDGAGYPYGLAGEDIPLLARILCVADALDAMTTHRAYRRALTISRARIELVAGSGTQFDPAVVDATLRLLDQGALAISTDAALAFA